MCSTAPRSEPAGLILAACSITYALLTLAIHASADWLTNAPAPTIPSRSINCRRVKFCSGTSITQPLSFDPDPVWTRDDNPRVRSGARRPRDRTSTAVLLHRAREHVGAIDDQERGDLGGDALPVGIEAEPAPQPRLSSNGVGVVEIQYRRARLSPCWRRNAAMMPTISRRASPGRTCRDDPLGHARRRIGRRRATRSAGPSRPGRATPPEPRPKPRRGSSRSAWPRREAGC